ncbi:MAG TPA: segregation/condensation protein A [Calditerricola sp.]
MTVRIKLEIFEGPLDLLLHLIEQEEVDITDIPIAHITEQYLAYLATMQELELEVASEFLVMAATLLHLKSKMLLPHRTEAAQPGQASREEDDPRAALVARLVEYKRFKDITQALREREAVYGCVYTRPPLDLSPYAPPQRNPVEGLTPNDLAQAFWRVLKRAKTRPRTETLTLTRDVVRVEDCMAHVRRMLEARGGRVSFFALFPDGVTREHVVVTFLAVLEMIRLGQVRCEQGQPFGEITLEWVATGGEKAREPQAAQSGR